MGPDRLVLHAPARPRPRGSPRDGARRLGDLLRPHGSTPTGPVVRPPDVGGRTAWDVLVRDGVLEALRSDAAVPAGTPVTPRLRAGLLRGDVPAGAAAAGRTAAWVHTGEPLDGDLIDLVYRAHGHRPAVWGRGLCWQAPLLRADVVELAGVRVTAPVRTVVDLALHVPAEDAVRRVLALVRTCGLDLDEADRQLERRVRVVGRPRARDVLGAARSALA